MEQLEIRRDWTPAEKLFFEDIAIEYLPSRSSHTRADFDKWLGRHHPDLTIYADFIWSYVLAL